MGEGHAVAHALHRLAVAPQAHGAVVQAVGHAPQPAALLAQAADQQALLASGQRADGGDAVAVQGFRRRVSHEQQRAHVQRVKQLRHIFPGDERRRVGLFVVTAHFGPGLVVADPHRDGDAQLLPDAAAQRVRDGHAVPEQRAGAGHVQPAFVHGEGFHLIGVFQIDPVDPLAHFAVLVMMGRQENQPGTLAPGLPDGFRRLHAAALGDHVFRQDDAVPPLGIPGHGHGLVRQVGPIQQLHRGEEVVAVAVEDGAVNRHRPDRPPRAGRSGRGFPAESGGRRPAPAGCPG